MEHSTIAEFDINDFCQMIGLTTSDNANNQSFVSNKLTLDDVKNNIDKCISKLINV